MKKILSLIFISLVFANCQKDNPELKKPFLGTWNNFPLGLHNEVRFYQDSVVIWDLCRKTVGTWKVNKSEIKMKYITLPSDAEGDKWTLNYKFSPSKDSIFFNHKNDTSKITMLKVKNHWEHFLKTYELKIEVPNVNSYTYLARIDANKYPEIFIGWRNDSLVVHSRLISRELKTTRDYAFYLLRDYESTDFTTSSLITLIVDKRVSKKSLDSIKGIISDLKIDSLSFFQVYKHENDEIINYGKMNPDCLNGDIDWYWYGLFDSDFITYAHP